MEIRQLGPRREQVLALVPRCRSLADVGAGDGQLAVELILRRLAERVIAIEKAEGPYRVVKAGVEGAGLSGCIEVRVGGGLMPLEVGEAEVAIVAGMGALTIRDILQQAPVTLAGMDALVLQPLNNAGPLRRWLWKNDLGIGCETLAEEKGRHYPVMLVQPEMPSTPLYDELGELNFELGTYLLKTGHPGLGDVLTRLERQGARVLSQLGDSQAPAHRERYWRERQRQLKEARKLWQQHVK